MKTKSPKRPPVTSVRFDLDNLAWLKQKAEQDKRGLGPYINMLVTRLRNKEAKP